MPYELALILKDQQGLKKNAKLHWILMHLVIENIYTTPSQKGKRNIKKKSDTEESTCYVNEILSEEQNYCILCDFHSSMHTKLFTVYCVFTLNW